MKEKLTSWNRLQIGEKLNDTFSGVEEHNSKKYDVMQLSQC